MNSTNQPKASQSDLVAQEERRNDLGFGTQITDARSRLMNPDGSVNVLRYNTHWWDQLNVYNRLITMGWWQFFSWLLLAYLIANTLFAGIYMLVGAESLQGVDDAKLNGPFWKCFFFSSQTLTTVGYGHISPDNFVTSCIAAFESMLGLLAFALATGLLYGRFSRPMAHVRFSKMAVVAPYLDVNGWMFRLMNTRSNQLINLSMLVTMSRLEHTPDRGLIRKYYNLNLERSRVNFFPTSWTVVHPITSESPLYGQTPGDMEKSDVEFIISLQATDDTFAQEVHTRTSYQFNEILWGRKFKPMFDGAKAGNVRLDINALDITYEAPLNP